MGVLKKMLSEFENYFMPEFQLSFFGRDDITYCVNKCYRTDCMRNQCHIRTGDIVSISMFNCSMLDPQTVVTLD